MAERVWVVHLVTYELRLMWAVDAREAVALGDYAYAPVGGYDPPRPTRGTGEWTGQQIAEELGWKEAATVTRHSNIKEKLHPQAWTLARNGLTKNSGLVNATEERLVNQELTSVNWAESHFRAFLSHLPCPDGDRAAMRAQVRAITALLAKPDKLTAKTAGAEAEKQAWHMTLLRQPGIRRGQLIHPRRSRAAPVGARGQDVWTLLFQGPAYPRLYVAGISCYTAASISKPSWYANTIEGSDHTIVLEVRQHGYGLW